MRLGLVLPQTGHHVTHEAVRRFAIEADRFGFDSLWVQEHLYYPLRPKSGYAGRPGAPMPEEYRFQFEALSTLAFVAALTERASLGTSILVAGYHRPVQLAKEIATIDHLSGGRVCLGLGVGWSEDEHDQSDTPFHTRGRRTDELIEALWACWGPDPVTFSGRWFEIAESVTSPKPVQGRIPLLGGFWSAAGHRRTARYCDWWQPAGLLPEQSVAGLAAINALAAEEYGRGPLQLSHRVFAAPHLPGVEPAPRPTAVRNAWEGTAEAMVPHVRECVDLGIDEVVIDCTFVSGLPGEEGWWRQPEFFAPLLEIAHA